MGKLVSVTCAWGWITSISVGGCDPARLADHGVIDAWATRMVGLLGVQAFDGPRIRDGAFGEPDREGPTCFVMIEASHVALHAVPQRGWAFVVIDSCAPYEDALPAIIEHCLASFGGRTWRMDGLEQKAPPEPEMMGSGEHAEGHQGS